MINEIFAQMAAAFNQWTSFQVGNFNFADFALSNESGILNSTFMHILELISTIAVILLAYASFRLAAKQKVLNQKTIAQTMAEMPQAGGILQDQWNDVLRHIESPREGEWKFALIEADKLADEVMGRHFPGDTMGERMRNVNKTHLLTIDGLREAHGLRNRLAHQPNSFIRHAEALRAIRQFEATLRELGVIE